MTDEKKDRDASRAIFGGIGDEDSQQTQRIVTPVSGGGSGSAEDGGGFGGPNSKSMLILVIVLSVLTVGSLVFGFTTFRSLNNSQAAYEDQINLLTRRLDSSDQVYADLKGQFQVSSDKLGLTQRDLARARRLANNIQKEQKVAVNQLSDAIEMKASTEELNRLQEESAARFSNLSSSISGTQRDLDATKEALAGTRDELGGLIAGNREELMALARRTDRDYFEFALAKKGARQKIGSVMIELRKVDSKRNLYTVRLAYDDKWTEKRNKSINEPVYFYPVGAPQPLELVINKIDKRGVTGYISTPRSYFPDATDSNVLQKRPV